MTTSEASKPAPITLITFAILTVIAALAAIFVPILGPAGSLVLTIITGIVHFRTRQRGMFVLAVINAFFTLVGVVVALTLLPSGTSLINVEIL